MENRDSGLGVRGSGFNAAREVAFLLMTFNLLGSAAGQSPATLDSPLRITVRVYDYAAVSSATLAGAKKEALRVFRDGGVDIAWLDCPVSRTPAALDQACEQAAGFATLNVKILSAAMAARLKLPAETLGHSLPSSNLVGASEAWIFYHRVAKLAETREASEAQILGYAAAHELGHLLLGPGRHSAEGLMRAQWRREDLRELATGQLRFSPQLSELIRFAISKRVRGGGEAGSVTAASRIRP